MKPIFLFFSFLLFHLLIYSQPNINKITWVGQNNEYLNISIKKTSLQKEITFREFKVVKFVKNKYIILSQTSHGNEVKQKYNIVRFTKDTLILAPEGGDLLTLAETNKQNRYVFVNSLLTYKFVELYYETSFYNFDNPKERLKFIVYIDSARRSRVVAYDDSFKEGSLYTAPPSKIEYKHLIQILSSYDISFLPEDDMEIDKASSYEILEISYNERVIKINGFTPLPFHLADKLEEFVCDYIESRVNINAKWGWRYVLRRQK